MTQHDKYADLSRLPIAEAEAFRAGMLKLLARLEAAEAVCRAYDRTLTDDSYDAWLAMNTEFSAWKGASK